MRCYGPAASIGASLLSRLDFSDSEVVKDAEHEFQRCSTDSDFARWARKWGATAIVRLHEVEGRDSWVSSEDMDEAEAETSRAERKRDELSAAINAAVNDLDCAMEGAPDALVNKVGDITSKLEAAL
jgi:hypothetical protein